MVDIPSTSFIIISQRNYLRNILNFLEQVIRYNLVWGSLRLIKCEAVYDSVNCSKPGYTSITCSQIKNIPYNLIFTTKVNDSSILITIISNDYLNLSLANGYVGDVTIPTQVIQYNQHFLQAD